MKPIFTQLLIFAPLFIMPAHSSEQHPSTPPANIPAVNRIKITVASETFHVTLENNKAAEAFMARFPVTFNMSDLHGNEKYCSLAPPLPVHASSPGRVNRGDIMLFGSSTLVIFYESSPTSYSYTRLGKIDHPDGLPKALGSGNAVVSFSKDDSR